MNKNANLRGKEGDSNEMAIKRGEKREIALQILDNTTLLTATRHAYENSVDKAEGTRLTSRN